MHLSVSIDASDAFQFLFFCLSFHFFFFLLIRGNMQHDINKSSAFNFLLQLEIFSECSAF